MSSFFERSPNSESKDEYKQISNNALERFLLCLQDIDVYLNTPPFSYDVDSYAIMYDFIPFYLNLCYKNKDKHDNSLTNREVKFISNKINKRKASLPDTIRYILKHYLNTV